MMDTSCLQSWLANDPLYRRIAAFLTNQPNETWLVGGTVRDILLGRPVSDIDLAVAGDALSLGKSLAHKLAGAYFPLDISRGVGRIILPDGECHIDLANLRAATIDADLRARDFTVNALGVPVDQPAELLDPTGGLPDLEQRLMRACSQETFTDDPLRILRLVRQGLALGFSLDPSTLTLISPALPRLADVSMERLRDEFMLVLALPGASRAASLLAELGALAGILARLGVTFTDELAFRRLDLLECWLGPQNLGYLGAWHTYLALDWARPLAGGRPRLLMIKLAGLLSELTKPENAYAVGAALCLSVRESRHLAAILGAKTELENGLVPAEPLERYLYFQRFGAAGLDGAVLTAAGSAVPDQHRPRLNELMAAWYLRYTREVEPPALLDGKEICILLGIEPGPRVGEMVEALRQAKVQDIVQSKAEAFDYLKRFASGQ
ncbi:MAG: tRNA nucleotidyltransferase/poly(A) polymerase family protein [Anaerolineae bacterium]